MAAALWDVVGKAANLAQLFGLDAVTLIIIAMSFLRFHEVNKECRKLEDRVQMLRLLLRCPAGCCWIMQQQHLVLGHLVTNALKDGHDLVESYNKSTLFSRVQRGRSMSRQFRDLRNSIDSYCGLILSINACYLLSHQANPPPPSLVSARSTAEVDGDVPPSTGYYSSMDAEMSTTTIVPHDAHVIINVTHE